MFGPRGLGGQFVHILPLMTVPVTEGRCQDSEDTVINSKQVAPSHQSKGLPVTKSELRIINMFGPQNHLLTALQTHQQGLNKQIFLLELFKLISVQRSLDIKKDCPGGCSVYSWLFIGLLTRSTTGTCELYFKDL